METSILLVDDHPVFLKGLRSLLEDEKDMTVIGEAGDGKTALDMIRRLSPQIVVMDITMPGLNGIETTEKIVSNFPGTKVIALSIHSEKEFVEGMLKAGATGYIVKESVPEELVKGIRVVINGEAYLSPSITGLIVSHLRRTLPRKQASKHIPIIETKLYRPILTKDHVHRQRLVSLLEKNRHLPLQNIIAPAGYGKTTLVSSWLKKTEWPNSWISLDKNDNDLHRFLSYLINAIQTLFPKSMKLSSRLLNSDRLPPIQVLADRLSTELDFIEQNFIVVLDDVHLIKEKKIHDLISELFRHPPEPFHLVIIGRSDPFLPIAKFRARRQLEEIRMNDLKFTQEETRIFLNQRTEKTIENKLVQKLTKKTEGWITGLQLASLSTRHPNDFNTILHELNGSPRYVMEYLFSEVFSFQPRQIKDYLLKTSILERFCTPLCAAVFNDTDSDPDKDHIDAEQFISLLKKENMFIIRLDADNQWYRYHHLFQKLLKNQLNKSMSPDKIATLHLRAGKWLKDQGFLDDSIHQTLAAGDSEAAARIVEKNRIKALDEDQWHTLEKWLDRLPSQIIQQRPNLLFSKAWILLQQARIAEITPIQERVKTLVKETSSDPLLQSEICFFQGLIFYFQGNKAQCLKLFIKSKALLPQKTFVSLRSNVEYWICMALHFNGQKARAIQKLHEIIHKTDMHEGMTLSRMTFALCFIHMLDVEFLKVLQEALRMRGICRVSHMDFAETWARYMQGNASFQMFDPDAAQKHFSWVIENRYIANPRTAVDAMAGLAITRQILEKPDKDIDETILLALEYANWAQYPMLFEIIRSCRARLDLMRGNMETACQWQSTLSKTSDNMIMLFFLEIPVITECRVLVACKSEAGLNKALDRLENLLKKSVFWHNTCQRIEILVLQALAAYHLGRMDNSLSILEEAVMLSAPGNGFRPFIEIGPPMVNMLNHLVAKNVTVETANQILAVFRDHQQHVSSVISESRDSSGLVPFQKTFQPLIDPLTNREMEILNLLGKHLYNKEIAEELFISPETVKTHLKKIYEKLEVGNRRYAVAKAKEIGLITG